MLGSVAARQPDRILQQCDRLCGAIAGPREAPADTTLREAIMRVIILGGDGFCGWPTALHLSARGHEVAIVDNLSRRNIDNELEVESLTPIRPMGERLKAWREVSGKEIAVPPGRRRAELSPPADAVSRVAARRGRPFRRAARGALLDEVAAAQALHGRQQHQRHPQRAGGDRRERRSTSTSSISARWASTATAPPGSRSRKAICR